MMLHTLSLCDSRAVVHRPNGGSHILYCSGSEATNVVVKVVSTHISYLNICSKDWDTEYYPEYIVVLHD